MKTIRIFISSPGDVHTERLKAAEILERLQAEFSGRLVLEPYFWEHLPMLAHTDFQTQIDPPSRFDFFVCVLWSRLGTRLYPGLHRKPDGSEYASGTEYEVLDALEGRREHGAPQVLIYKRKDIPRIDPTPKDERERKFQQYDSLNEFLKDLTQKDGFFVRATTGYHGLAEFETRFESDLRKLLGQSVPPGVSGSSRRPKSWANGSPFRGLSYFDFEHAPIFFGRTRAMDEVIGALQRQAGEERAFVLVFGGSGVGKSSLVRAGVLPWLVRPSVIDGVDLWRRAIMRPGEMSEGDLFDGLATVLLRIEGLPEIGSDGTDAVKLARLLRENPQGASLLIKGALSQAAREVQINKQLLQQPRALFALVLDQFEELFTIQRLGSEREGFLRAIDALARSGYVWVIATLRSDFYSRCEESAVLMQLKQGSGQYHLQPPDAVGIGQMIRLPASAAGLLFEEDQETGERLDDILRDAAIKNPAALPLLEFALQELYEQRDTENGILKLESYRKLGGVEGALGRRAEESFASASAEARAAFDHVFRHLVTIDATEGQSLARRRATKAAVAGDPASAELIDRLVADRLLVAERTETGSDVISIAHEAMLGSWERLAQWVTLNRESLKMRAQISADTNRWLENDRHSDYLYAGGAPLEKAHAAMKAGFLAEEETEFVELSLAKVAEEGFRTSLLSGNGLLEISARLHVENPEVRLRVLREALSSSVAGTRRHAAVLIGEECDALLGDELVNLLVNGPADDVRYDVACSLIQLNRKELFSAVANSLDERHDSRAGWRAMSELRAAADMSKTPTSFEPTFARLNRSSRTRIRFQSALLRLRRGAALLLVFLVPAITLSCMSAAAFKWFPGLFNFALCQDAASAAMGVFHAITAAILWGGTITLGVTLYYVVFARAAGRKSYLHPIGAVVAGMLAGVVSSVAVVTLILAVYSNTSKMGWTKTDQTRFSVEFWHELLFGSRLCWPYLVMGTALGIGMALTINRLSASERWNNFLAEQSALRSGRQIWRVICAMTKMGVRFAWPIALSLSLGSVLAFAILRGAPSALPAGSSNWMVELAGGLSRDVSAIRAWKLGPWGQALGISGDALTQGIGGFFAIIGIGLGRIVGRYGINIEPRKT